MSIEKINSENINEKIKDNKLLLDFYADWCGPCKTMLPVLDEISKEKNSVPIYKVNIDESPELASKYGVMSVPTFILIENGEEKRRLVGLLPRSVIKEMLDK